MATKKTTDSKKKPASGRAPAKNGAGRSPKAKSAPPSGALRQTLPFIFYVSALLVLLVLLLPDTGVVVEFLRDFLFGTMSVSAFAAPLMLVLLGVFWHDDDDPRRVGWRFWCSVAVWVLFAVMMHIILSGSATFNINELYESGIARTSGGVIGGLIGSVFVKCFGRVISIVILAAALFILCLLLFGLTPAAVFSMLGVRMKEKHAARRERIAEYEARRREDDERLLAEAEAAAESAQIPPAMTDKTEHKRAERAGVRHRKFNTDVDISADEKDSGEDTPPETPTEQDEIDKKIFDEVMRRTRERYGEQSFESGGDKNDADKAPAKSGAKVKKLSQPSAKTLSPVASDPDAKSGEVDLESIFVDPESIGILRGDGDGIRAPYEMGSAGSRQGYVFGDEIGEADINDAQAGIFPDAGFDDDDIEAMVNAISEPEMVEPEDEPEVEDAVPVYEFPPISLLTPPQAATAADVEELKQTAQRLVDTLRSFKVKTKISDVFHGPTITRYELTPETGTRVSAIANLSDDIALNLAAESVRIEAPIPGKAAVGVEVPNRVRETVSLRQLFETEQFQNAKGLLTAALGCDVAGAPVFCDISKMPHLLIAGTTGGGKSVCINCIVMSILYRARPDQVRLIMIDPKQVEFVPYNGIPHLHVPVVSDAKKAAGTLSWAVGEMEKRYEMIRDVGVRNIDGYNKITENDPEKMFMPYLVIVIDELADLMMTAPDDVETHICRIAQMGRAAGVHVIIGTQRPSVDVVTGLIKANFPSRIALTVAQQVDSRTILGTGGAEKLLGKGDMLFAPIGSTKPQRVQGAFVSDSEVEAVTDFLKGTCPTPHYDEAAIDGIEEAARQCGNKKGRGGAASSDDDEGKDAVFGDDPMFRQALELAVDSGKISTSLIQRRLSLGYGRAAKLIDRMEALGYVGPQDASRPREVLLTRQQFQELVLRSESD